MAIPRESVVSIRDTLDFSKDPEHCERADDTDAEAEAHERGEALQL